MKLKAKVAILLWIIPLFTFQHISFADEETDIPKSVLLNEVASANRLLFSLAAERYSAHTNRGEVWILTVHEGAKPRKFTDKKFTVLSLPANEKKDRAALCRYVANYNSFVLNAADHKVMESDYKRAGEIYRLLLRFDKCELIKDEVEQRLACLDRIARGEEIESNRKLIMNLHSELFTKLNLTEAEKMTPTIVPDLMQLRSP